VVVCSRSSRPRSRHGSSFPWDELVRRDRLGAIVAPPDASAATAVLRKLRPPHRIVVILEAKACSTMLRRHHLSRGRGRGRHGHVFGLGRAAHAVLSCGGGVIAASSLRAAIWGRAAHKDIQGVDRLQFIARSLSGSLRNGSAFRHNHRVAYAMTARVTHRGASGAPPHFFLRRVGGGGLRANVLAFVLIDSS